MPKDLFRAYYTNQIDFALNAVSAIHNFNHNVSTIIHNAAKHDILSKTQIIQSPRYTMMIYLFIIFWLGVGCRAYDVECRVWWQNVGFRMWDVGCMMWGDSNKHFGSKPSRKSGSPYSKASTLEASSCYSPAAERTPWKGKSRVVTWFIPEQQQKLWRLNGCSNIVVDQLLNWQQMCSRAFYHLVMARNLSW